MGTARRFVLFACIFVLVALPLSGCLQAKVKWTQIAGDGIADHANIELYPGPEINSKLPVGTFGRDGERAYLYAWDGFSFKQVGIRGFGWENRAIVPRAIYRGVLYIGTVNDVSGGQVWKWNGSGDPELVADKGLGTSDVNAIPLGVMNDKLIVGTGNYKMGKGLSIFTYDGATWEQVIGKDPPGTSAGPGFGDNNNISCVTYGEVGGFPGMLLFGVYNLFGTQVYSYDGKQFRLIGSSGEKSWSAMNKTAVSCVGAGQQEACFGVFNSIAGSNSELWTYNGEKWTATATAGINDPANAELFPLENKGKLYVSSANPSKGAMIYRQEGGSFKEMCEPGLGDTFNIRVKLVAFEGKLFAFADNNKASNVYVTDI